MRLSLTFLVLCLGGCSDATGPRLFTSFNWGEVEDPATVVAGITSSVAFGELFILGQFNTPTRCYKLDADFKRNGGKLTILVRARSSNSPNCDQSLGGFRYTAVFSNLEFGTYELTAVHDISGGTGGSYEKTVVIK